MRRLSNHSIGSSGGPWARGLFGFGLRDPRSDEAKWISLGGDIALGRGSLSEYEELLEAAA